VHAAFDRVSDAEFGDGGERLVQRELVAVLKKLHGWV